MSTVWFALPNIRGRALRRSGAPCVEAPCRASFRHRLPMAFHRHRARPQPVRSWLPVDTRGCFEMVVSSRTPQRPRPQSHGVAGWGGSLGPGGWTKAAFGHRTGLRSQTGPAGRLSEPASGGDPPHIVSSELGHRLWSPPWRRVHRAVAEVRLCRAPGAGGTIWPLTSSGRTAVSYEWAEADHLRLCP